MNFHPINGYVLVKELMPEKTPLDHGRVVIGYGFFNVMSAFVVATSELGIPLDDGTFRPHNVCPGDGVMIKSDQCVSVTLDDGNSYFVLEESAILGIVK